MALRDVLWHDVEVRWVDDDLKPHKKYFWALQEFPDDYVITTDDDLLYRNTMIGDLLAAHEAHPHAVAAVRTHLIMFNEDGSRTNYEVHADFRHEWGRYAVSAACDAARNV